jgi:hypothetical protein
MVVAIISSFWFATFAAQSNDHEWTRSRPTSDHMEVLFNNTSTPCSDISNLFILCTEPPPSQKFTIRSLEKLIQTATSWREARKPKCARGHDAISAVSCHRGDVKIIVTSRQLMAWCYGLVTSIQQCEHSPCCFPLPPLYDHTEYH